MDSEQMQRAETLLKAAHDMLTKCDNSPIVICPMETTVFYDEAECDGHCLREDIQHWFEASDKPLT